MPPPALAIATGDPAGIGPEVSLKAALDPAVRALCRPVLFGDRKVLETHARACGLSLEGIELRETEPVAELELGKVKPAHGRATIAAAQAAVRAALAGEVAAVVGAPHTEAAVHAAGIAFDGYPSFVARLAGLAPEDGILMLCFAHAGREVRIAHVTLHSSVAQALRLISEPQILRTVSAAARALKAMGIESPRIAVSGVNPHAGEGGLFGDEEQRCVRPAIEAARREGIDAEGPFGADTLFLRAGYDAYVVMLHDQGHIAAKLLAPRRVAGLAIGTPVLFSSVGHGSALDIAGRGIADAGAMVEAISRLLSARALRGRGAPSAA